MSAKITFCGGAGTVTGANFLFDTGEKRILVDCGALERETPSPQICDEENLKPFSYDPKSIDALIITHAHQDHIGRVPKLVRDGFRGLIFSTPATKDLSAIMFDDALSIMESQFEKHGCAKVYEQEDVANALSLWSVHEYHEPFEIGDAKVVLLDAGHILGSATIKIMRRDRVIIFTGDIGNSPEPLLNNVESPEGTNYLVMESVYGDRVHEDRDARRNILKTAIEGARNTQGVLLIPSFSIERTQVLLFEIREMIEKKEIAPIPVYLDAPLAIKVTDVFEKYKNDLNTAAAAEAGQGSLFSFPGFVETHSSSDSRELHAKPDPKIIIAGAGMSSGGRIRAHEKRYLSDPHASVLLVGYQAPGSLGRRIQDGQKEISIEGEHIRVRATINTLTGYSGHADREQLLDFVERSGKSLEKVFVVMGEPKSSLYLSQRIRDFLGVYAIAPAQNDSFDVNW